MPTVGWIQETVWDRYYERGADGKTEKYIAEYPCRMCEAIFRSISERDQHEIGHPVLNPTLFIDRKEIRSERLEITASLYNESVYLRNVDFISVNGNQCNGASGLQACIVQHKNAFLDISYGNSNIERRVKIHICIADEKELQEVDDTFSQCFGISELNDRSIIAFTEKVRSQRTVKYYSDGLVRYLQGVMAKDNRTGSANFDKFIERFNQATQSMKSYNTALSKAINAVVNFNRNDFSEIQCSGIPSLDNALGFFLGGEVIEDFQSDEAHQLPVDYATESVLNMLLKSYKSSNLIDIEAEIKGFSPQYLSLQDKAKFDYICWRKSLLEGRVEAQKTYRNRLKHDDAFVRVVELMK